MSNPSRLDLTGQASEDEPASRTSQQQQQQRNDQRQRREQSQSQQTNKTNNSSTTNDLSNTITSREREGILSYLPSPIDLWQSRTPTSLLLLPLVFIIFVILQLPLHYNSTTENAATIDSLSKNEWRGRVREIDKLSKEMSKVEKDLDTVKGDQKKIKRITGSLRRRLGKMKERRHARDEFLRIQERERREREKIKKNQQGMAKDGPVSTVSMAKAVAVATFAGKTITDELAKKDD